MRHRQSSLVTSLFVIALVLSTACFAAAANLSFSIPNGSPGSTVQGLIGFDDVAGVTAFNLVLTFSSGSIITTDAAEPARFTRNTTFFPSLTVGGQAVNFVQEAQTGRIYFVGLSPASTSGPALLGKVFFPVSAFAALGDEQVLTLSGEAYTDTGEAIDLFPVSVTFTVVADGDSDGDGLSDSVENGWCTDPTDADSDDDGIQDGIEDANHNGAIDPGETNPCNRDSDNDGIQDGTEKGCTLANVGLDTDLSIFKPDLDPSTTTNPLDDDSDGDGIKDGIEDANQNGRVDPGESDPQSGAGEAPTAETGSASLLSRTSVRLQATVNPCGSVATVEFQWGLDTTYGWVASASPGSLSGTEAQSVSAEITGLDLNTVYHYRVVAANVYGTAYGEDMTFTSGCSPQIAVTTGQFDTDAAEEFAVAEVVADSTVLLTFYDNDGVVLGQASTGAVQEISLARGQFDADAQDEAALACVMADATLAAFIFNPDGNLVSQGAGGMCSNVTIATGQFDTDAYDEYVVTLLQSAGTLAAISFNHDGTRIGKGVGGVCSTLCVGTGNFDSNAADDEYVVSLLQSDGTLAAITFQGDGSRIGKGIGGLCTNVNVAAGNFRSDNDPQEEYVVSLLQSDGTLAAISFYGDGTRIGKGTGGLCTNVNIASGWYQATSPLDGYVVSLNQADNTPAAIFYTGTGTRIGKGTGPEAVLVTDIDCGDIDGDGYDEAVLGYIAESDLMMYWMVFKESGLEVMIGP